jgi:hypothetical protein
MYRREITERESASSRGKQKERTSARQKREPRCFRAFIPRRRERERKEIYRTITRGGLFLPRKKQKFNRRCLGGRGRKEDAARTKLSMSGTPAALTCWFNIGYRSLSHR